MLPGDIFNPYKLFVGIFIPNALVRHPNITPSAKLLYGRLSQYAGENGKCFPSEDLLAAEIGLSKRQIYRLISELETEKFIACQKAGYVFLWHDIFDQNVVDSCDKLSQTCDTDVTKLCHVRHKSVSCMSQPYKVLRESVKRIKEEVAPPRHPDAIASEKATAALVVIEDRLRSFRGNGSALVIEDRISRDVIVNDLGGKDAALKMTEDELRAKFTRNYVRRELAAYQARRT